MGRGHPDRLISDIRELLPGDLPALEDVDELERATGVSGVVYVTVNADDLTDPAVIAWMHEFEDRMLPRHGFRVSDELSRRAGGDLPRDLALHPLRRGEAPSPGRSSRSLTSARLRLAGGHRSRPGLQLGTTLITFGIRVMPFDQQKQLIDDIRAQVDPPGIESDPPPGVTAQVVGLPVLAADANSALSGTRYLVTAALLAVALVLLAVYRSARRALVPLIPIVLRDGLVVARALADRRAAQPDVGDARGAGHRDRNRVQRHPVGALPRGARRRRHRRGGAAPRLRPHRHRGARVRGDRDRRLRGADRLRHPDAAATSGS